MPIKANSYTILVIIICLAKRFWLWRKRKLNINLQYIPLDNDGSKRAIRNLKVKLKVSQRFKSSQSAKDYVKLRFG